MITFDSKQFFLVTGASSGLGEGVALHLNALGASVIAIARNNERLQALKEKCTYPDNMHIEIRDLATDIDTLPEYVKSLRDKYGKLQGLAYCAGIASVKPLQLLDYASERALFDINYYAPLFMIKGFSDRRINNGKGSAIVVISSIAAKLNDKGNSIYSGTKAAITSSCRCLAKELAPRGVRLNCVSPSIIKTPLIALGGSIDLSVQEKRYPFGFGEVDDVANIIVFLLSDKSKWITAQDYVVDCGTR